jgi:ATP-dependent DNA helicase RecG
VAGEITSEVLLLQVLDSAPLPRVQAQSVLGLKGRANFRDRYLEPALESGLIEMTIPDKPRSSQQKYRLTDKGGLYWSLQNGNPKELGAH